jgi:hypothetical protein
MDKDSSLRIVPPRAAVPQARLQPKEPSKTLLAGFPFHFLSVSRQDDAGWMLRLGLQLSPHFVNCGGQASFF